MLLMMAMHTKRSAHTPQATHVFVHTYFLQHRHTHIKVQYLHSEPNEDSCELMTNDDDDDNGNDDDAGGDGDGDNNDKDDVDDGHATCSA